LRNEAIFRDRRLDGWSYGGGFGVGLGAFGGLEAAEFAEGGVVVALGGIDAALEAGENVAVFFEDQAEGDVEDVQGVFPELCLDGAQAAEDPFAIDEGIDEGTLFGGGRLEAIEVFGGELVDLDSPRMIRDLASMPDCRAFIAERALPSSEQGPVDFCELRRLAAICFWVAIRGEVNRVVKGWGWPRKVKLLKAWGR